MLRKTLHALSTVILFLIPTFIFAGEDMMMLSINTAAPAFTLLSSDNDTVSLGDFKGDQYVVLIFYPGDHTPVCTAQLCAIRDDYGEFEKKNARVFGINPGNMKSHTKFIENNRFQFPLLIDENRAVAKLYGCDGWPMIKRTVYVIDPQGIIIYAKRGKPANEEIFNAIPEQ